MVMFVLRQLSLQKADKALLDLRTFGSKNYTFSVVMMAVAMMSLFGTVILLPIYLQNVLGQNTQTIGLMLLPGGLLMGLLGPTVGRLYDKIGPTPLLVPGTILVAAVMWALTLVDQNTSIWAILVGHIAISVGLALVFTPLFTASMSSVGPQFYSHASAILGSVQQVAGATGVALFIAVMTAQTVALTATGLTDVEALAGGIRSAFLIGAVLSLLPIACAFFVKKPAAQPGMEHMGH
jgi:DHA2 family lincomycin resistance protein-like MFS transporter